MDWWGENEDNEAITGVDGAGHLYHGNRADALVSLVRRIREAVGDDFLIMVNTDDKIPRSAPYVNGAFMETLYDGKTGIGKAHAREHFIGIENTLLWFEENLRYPQVNFLEAFGIASEPPDSPENQRQARAFMTLSLTHSNGYVMYTTGIIGPDENHPHAYEMWEGHSQEHARGEYHIHHHQQYWYPFYDADLGQPIGEKGQTYEGIDGLFIREFTNGWAIYNRSGKTQSIQLSEMAIGAASGMRKRRHTLPDLDGEIYLKIVVKVAPGKHPPLYWVNAKTGTLHHLANNKVENLVPEVQNAISLAVDAAAGKLYWTEKTGNRTGKIQGANLDGTNLQLVKDLTSAPLEIAIDTTAGKIYLSNTWGKIQRMNLNGSGFQPNLITSLKTPQNLVLDTTNSKLYWTEQISKMSGKVQRANLDGSNVQLVKKLTSTPRGMALDAVNRKLYLTNTWGKLQRMNLDGSNFQPNFITGLASPRQVVVDMVANKLYWTEEGKLRRVDLDGGNIQDVVIGLGELTDLTLGIDSAGQTGIAAAPMTQTVVEQTSLLANYPNPFNPETWIPYHLANDTDVEIHIYDTRGSLVRRLELGHQRAGIYTGRGRAAYWDGRNDVGERVASGIYFYQLKADNVSLLRKMVILK